MLPPPQTRCSPHGRSGPLPRAALLLVLGLSLTACSLIVDKNAHQCVTDADCAHFGAHPLCQGGVCVPSGLGPPGCFYGTPTTQADYLNQCSNGQCIPFDNCARSVTCDGGLPALLPPQTM